MLLLFKSGGHKQQLTLSHASLRLLLEYLPGGHACSTPPIFVVVVFRCGISHSHLLNIFFEEEENFFFWEKFLKTRHKEEEKERIASPQKSESFFESSLFTHEKKRRKKEEHKERDSITSILFLSSCSLSLSLSLLLLWTLHTHINFPG